MTLAIYVLTVPPFKKMLTNLSGILEKGANHAAEHGLDPDDFVSRRLAPDMHPLSFQVQSATDRAKFALSRLSGRDAPSWPDDEKTVGDLQARVAKALDYAESFTEADFASAETRQVTFRARGREMTLSAQDYLLDNAIPNFYFHVTAAYLILRNAGVPLGKRDFTG